VKSFGVAGDFAEYGESQSDLPVEIALASPRKVIAGARSTDEHDGSFTTSVRCGRAPALREASKSIDVSPNEQASVKATCPRGSSVRLGGFRQTIGSPHAAGAFVMMNGLQRVRARVLKVSGINYGTETGRLGSFAYCGAPLHQVHAVETTRTADDGEYVTATARCPRGSRFVMGGLRVQHYASSQGDIYLTAMGPAGHRGWSVTGFKYAPVPGHLTAIAYCRG
jgi:hypothetical protein